MKYRQLEIGSLPIVVIDEFFSDTQRMKIHFVMKSLKLERGGLTYGNDPTTLHYAAEADYSLVKDFPFFKRLVNEAESLLKEEVLCGRMIYREFVYGDQPDFHVDSKVPGKVTAVLYLNEEWKEHDRGETLFSDDSGIGVSVLPTPGRAVLFDARINHTSNAPSRNCYKTRQLVVFNFEAKSLKT
jgi:hypothetical protein